MASPRATPQPVPLPTSPPPLPLPLPLPLPPARAPAPPSPLSQEALNTLLVRATSSAELSPELVAAVKSWILQATAAAAPADGPAAGSGAAGRAVSAFLDALAAQAAQAKGPPGAVARARGAALGLFARMAGGGGGGTSERGGLPTPDYADVRCSHMGVVAFAPRHVAGDRVPPPGAAASRPPPSYVVVQAPPPSAQQLQLQHQQLRVPAAAAPFAAAAGGVWPLPPADAEAAGDGGPLHLEPCPLHTPLTVALTLTNVGRARAVVSCRPLQSFGEDQAWVLSVEPATLALKRGESAQLLATLRLLRPGALVEAFIVVETVGAPAAGGGSAGGAAGGGQRLLLLARALAERTVFGVRLSDVPAVRSGGYDGIPLPLAQLRDCLLSIGPAAGGDGRNGSGAATMLQTEGIFRVAPSNEEKAAIRRALNDGTFSGGAGAGAGLTVQQQLQLQQARRSPIAVAHMIKVFLRELPQPLFSAIPTETLLSAASEEECIALIGWLTPPAAPMFAWLVDLLVEVARHERLNKMGSKNLAICTGPNLFVTDESVNPMEALMTSQKAVNALFRVITARAAGGPRDIFAEHLGVSAPSVMLQLEGDAGVGVGASVGASASASASASEGLSSSAGVGAGADASARPPPPPPPARSSISAVRGSAGEGSPRAALPGGERGGVR